MTAAVLVVNAGSSSIKFALYAVPGLEPLFRGEIGGIGRAACLRMTTSRSADPQAGFGSPPEDGNHEALTGWLLDTLRRNSGVEVVAAGHRVAHGGQDYVEPLLIDATVVAALERLIPLAPNHQPHNLAAISAIAERWPDLAQVACFDTAFHRTQPRLAQLFGLPRCLADEGVLRYGFHGLSYEYISSVLASVAGQRASGRVIVAHLGHGASMCAMHDGRSFATTMGFTALDGLIMGKRCGTLDPGVLLYLLQQKGMRPEEVARLLNNESGLLGVSGVSDDVRELEVNPDPHAKEALALFAYRAAREMGSLAAALNGLDVLVFTAGIGENSAGVRMQICELSAWLGIEVEAAANIRNGPRISKSSSVVDVYAIPTDEEVVIARATKTLIGSSMSPQPTLQVPNTITRVGHDGRQ